MQESLSSSSFLPSETATTDTFQVDTVAEFRKRNLFQAAIMHAWLEAHPDQDEIAWVALFAEAFARAYASAGETLPQDAAQDGELVRAWMRRLEQEEEASLS